MNYRKRRESLKRHLQRDRLDSIFITKRENIIYLCGLDAEGATLFITKDDRDYMITDPRFAEQAQATLSDFDIRSVKGLRYAVINTIAKRRHLKRVGFEGGWLAYNDYKNLKRALKGIRLVPANRLIEDLRIIKDNDELALIKRAISIIKNAYLYARKMINPKQTGQHLAVIIDNYMRKEGAQGSAFPTIVAQNPYSSYPHASATKAVFGNNCAVLIDAGALYGGYNSDLTRVIFLGKITTKYKYIYNILKAAQELAIKKIKPGLRISKLDSLARRYIAKKGFGRYFIHSLGHGVGLEVHESPRISRKNKGVLHPGMVFTVEPGIYIRGWGGLRLEDMVVVTEDGCEVLTCDIPK